MTGAISLMARQLLERDRSIARRRHNPHPANHEQSGSATSAVLWAMRRHPTRRWRRAQLIALTGRSESAIDWALLYLRRQHRIEAQCQGFGRVWVYWLGELQLRLFDEQGKSCV